MTKGKIFACAVWTVVAALFLVSVLTLPAISLSGYFSIAAIAIGIYCSGLAVIYYAP